LNDDPYFGINISCDYHDLASISTVITEPIFLSINIQILYSKHEKLVQLLHDLSELNIVVDAIAVQEIWDIRYPELVNIPGFNPLLFRKRTGMRGGGGGVLCPGKLTCNDY
jgi:hypothetical protein